MGRNVDTSSKIVNLLLGLEEGSFYVYLDGLKGPKHDFLCLNWHTAKTEIYIFISSYLKIALGSPLENLS